MYVFTSIGFSYSSLSLPSCLLSGEFFFKNEETKFLEQFQNGSFFKCLHTTTKQRHATHERQHSEQNYVSRVRSLNEFVPTIWRTNSSS